MVGAGSQKDVRYLVNSAASSKTRRFSTVGGGQRQNHQVYTEDFCPFILKQEVCVCGLGTAATQLRLLTSGYLQRRSSEATAYSSK